jgi:c(7)-type cytochrome triheme protein
LKKIRFLVLLVFFLMTPLAAVSRIGGGDIVMKTSFGNAPFSHEKHAAKGLSCQSCHPALYLNVQQHKTITMKEMEQGASCGRCHDGKHAFTVKGNCQTCHQQ